MAQKAIKEIYIMQKEALREKYSSMEEVEQA
jgi:hypothetical protein